MKYIFFLLIAAAVGYHFYMPHNTHTAQSVESAQDRVEPTNEDDPELKAKPEAVKDVRMVQIHGKWYEYRSDNTYNIDGVPTLFIPQARPTKVIAKAVAANSEPAAQAAKSGQLLETAVKNPLKVYTPDGFRSLQDGVAAAQHSNNNRVRALEDATKD